MDKLKILQRIQELYAANKNIIKHLKELDSRNNNSIEDIMISYDFQAGTYAAAHKKDPSFKHAYTQRLADIIDGLGDYSSLVEIGIGEATTLGPLLQALRNKPLRSYGFDISWSRIKFAKQFMNDLGIQTGELFVGDLFCAPLKDNSIDIVYTSHSIEPNGGREKEALLELYRITNKYLILLEPSYEFADEQARQRMLDNGYITRLHETAVSLGFHIIEHRLFGLSANPLNPTGLMIIQKQPHEGEVITNPLCCPLTKTGLAKDRGAFYSKESLLAYPIIDDIPCLLPQNAVIATKFTKED